MKTQKLLLIVAALTLTFSCEKKEELEDLLNTNPTDGSQSKAQLAGDGTYCSVTTGLGGSYAAMKTLTLNSDGTYTYYVHFSDSATCANSVNSGGNNVATYYQAGLWSVGGTNTTPSTSTKLVFVVGSGNMVIYGSGGGYASAIATWMNSNCTPNPGFNTSADETKTVTGTTCTSSGQYSAVNLPAASDSISNIGYNPGSGTFSLGSSTGQDVWRPGGSTFPSSYTFTFYSW